MSGTDKAKNQGQELGGKLKQGIGKLTGNRRLEQEGRDDQTKSNLKQAAEKAKDAFKHQ